MVCFPSGILTNGILNSRTSHVGRKLVELLIKVIHRIIAVLAMDQLLYIVVPILSFSFADRIPVFRAYIKAI